jgi:hypothetical protein
MNIGNIAGSGEHGEPAVPADAVEAGLPYGDGCSAEQLREILDRGLAAGDAFVGAAAEIERRASETARRARGSLPDRIEDRRRGLMLLGAVLVAAAIGAAAAFYQLFS